MILNHVSICKTLTNWLIMLAIFYKKLMLSFQSFLQSASGVAAIEYAVMAVAVAGVITAIFGANDGAYQTLLTTFVTTIEGFMSGNP